MDNSEFETRVFANPEDNEQDFLDAVMALPERQKLLNEVRSFNDRLGRLTNGVSAPPELSSRLKSLVTGTDEEVRQESPAPDNVVRFPGRLRPTRRLSMAAVLVLAVGVAYSSLFGGNQPSAAEIAFGQQIVNHIYMELDEIGASSGASLQQVNQAVSSIGGALTSAGAISQLGISFAKPCAILPQGSSAHLVVSGNRGAVNIIITDNSPVRREFSFTDERFEAVIIPLEKGNLILVGEKNERLTDFQEMLNETLTWSI
ncbi:MAG: DUF3379 family protein [Gammaproteobacteria bacterium]|jgi:hypothetical protein